MTEPEIEKHPLKPFTPSRARVLMLGSFPPPRTRWSMDFYYPNLQNDMWRIFGWVFFSDKAYFLTPDGKVFAEERIKAFLRDKGIALSDTAEEVVRTNKNASDKFLYIVKPLELEDILQRMPACDVIVATGQKAAEILSDITGVVPPKVGEHNAFTYAGRSMRLYRMPSSSRAYPKPLEEKAEMYMNMFKALNMI